MKDEPPNNSPEPPPITFLVPHSRLTVMAARLSFCRWLRDVMITRFILLLSVVMLGVICTGCSGLSSNPARFEGTVTHWLPVGTSDDDMKKIMQQHGFVLDYCEMPGNGVRDYHYYHVTRFHSWLVAVHEQDEKIDTTNFPVRIFFELIPIKT
jgi:hypothetical protein